MEDIEEIEGTYATISALIDKWLPSYGDWFTREDVWRHITGQGIILSQQGKQNVWKKLDEEIRSGRIKRRGKRYKFVNPDIVKFTNPWQADGDDIIHLKFPISHFGDEYSEFGFDKKFNIHKGDVIIIGGESNEGKTTMAMNMLADNMDEHKCRFVSTETTDAKFRKRMDRMDWAECLNGDGTPKFEFGFLEEDDYEDIIASDKINFVDWVALRGDFWEIGNIIRAIKAILKKGGGVAVLVLQKKVGQDDPVGGEFARRFADVALAISRGVLKVLKAKDWNPPNPNYKQYAFEIMNGGSSFCNIREVEDCPQCRGRKYYGGGKCSVCNAKGYKDKGEDNFLGGE